jgi:hypothetical protein
VVGCRLGRAGSLSDDDVVARKKLGSNVGIF